MTRIANRTVAAAGEPGRRKLGELLVASGVLTENQLHETLRQQRVSRGRLGRVVVDLGFATEHEVLDALAEQLNLPAVAASSLVPDADALATVSREFAVRHNCLPWVRHERELFLVTADPSDLRTLDDVAFHSGLRISPVLAAESELAAAIARCYGVEGSVSTETLDLSAEVELLAADTTVVDQAPRLADANSTPAIRLVNAILADAVRAGASDIHVEPHAAGVLLRYRVDGLLRRVMDLPRRVHARLVGRVKILAHMDISERRRPQDGRAVIGVEGQQFDLRMSTLPGADGEKIVIRVLAQARTVTSLDQLMAEPVMLASFQKRLHRAQGMVLVTGPTGSGKTSTLYAAINALRGETTNIVTVEDPVECRLPGVVQVQVAPRAGVTFASGLRSILRQDPDVIMVGEVRDEETAAIAFQAAQTGHMVLSTLHTNDAASTITRLLEMGVPHHAVVSSLSGVLAQRLVRRLCSCRRVLPDGTAEPVGCTECRNTGFRGRVGIFEWLPMTPHLRALILARSPEDVIRSAALDEGMTTLYRNGMRLVAAGITVEEEVTRVVPEDEAGEPAAPAGATPPLPAAALRAA